MHWLDYTVIGVYLLSMVLLGVVFSRHQSREEFFEAGRSMGVLTVGLSVMATLFSSNSFVMYPSAAYSDGFKLGLTLVAHSLIVPLIVWVFIPVYTRLKCRTAYEYLELRFDGRVRTMASGLFVFLRIGWMAAATYAASVVVARISGIDQIAVIVGLGVVSILYTMLGGLRAVMWTDVAQFFVFSATILIALWLLVDRTDLTLGAILGRYFEEPRNAAVDFSFSMELKFGSWAVLIGIFIEALSAFGADQVAVQRYLSARSEKTSQIAFLLNMAGIWLVVPALLVIGAGLFVYYGEHPAEMESLVAAKRAELGASASESALAAKIGDEAMPHFVKSHFPAGLKGLFLAALLAAIMSSLDSGIHSVTTALIVDFRDRLRPSASPPDERREVRLIRMLIVGIGVLAVLLACFVGDLGNVFDIGKKLMSAFGGPLLAVFILALFWRGATANGVFAGALLAAPVTFLAMYAFPRWFSSWFWVVGFALAIVLSIVLSKIDPARTHRATEPLTFREILRRSVAKP